MRTLDIICIAAYFMVTAFFINSLTDSIKDQINKNHKIQMEQIQKSIDTNTKFLNALNRAVKP